MQSPKDYGSSVGGYRPIEPTPGSISLQGGGLDYSRPPEQLENGLSSTASDVKFDKGGVSPDYDVLPYGIASASAADRSVLKTAPFELASGLNLIMRLRPTKWDRHDGLTWLELGGVLTGTDAIRPYSLNYGDRFIAANGIDKLKSWDGNDASSVVDLSADSPIARFITKIGNRILAAYIKIGATIFPFDVKWTTDGIITDWTTANLGAGAATLGPEGSTKSAGIITGLSTLQGAGVIYRQSSIMMALLTGVGAAPFRFTTVDFGHGTQSPDSIARGGLKTGDYFLGDDMMVYFFDGQSLPVGISEPIHDNLKSAVSSVEHVCGAVDARGQEYWLAIPTDSTLLLKRAYIFNIREWVKTGRLSWRQRALPGLRSLDSIAVPNSIDPIVDTITDFVDDVGGIVDEFANTSASDRLVFGDDTGLVSYIDFTTPLTSGVWTSGTRGDPQRNLTIERVRLLVTSAVIAQVEVSISIDNGSFANPIIYDIPVTNGRTIPISDWFGLFGCVFQFKLRFLSGDPVVSQIGYTFTDHGRAN